MEKSLDKTIEIAERMAFLQLEASGIAALKSSKGLIDRELPVALDKFYDQVRKTPEVARFFSNPDHMSHAKSAQQGHWQNISNGAFNEDYAKKVRTIGTVHARIGLEPRWYIGGYAIVADHLIRAAIHEELGKKRFFGNGEKTADKLGEAIGALVKAVFLDMDLAISIYAEQAEADKKKAQEAAIQQERELVSNSFGTALKQIANHDLTCRINDTLPAAYEPLRNDFNSSIAELEAMIGQIGQGAVAIRSSTAELSEAANHCSRRTEMQAASLEESASALRQVTEAMKETTQRARDVQTMVEKAMTETTQSGSVLGRTIGAMGAIESSSREIGNILSVIDDIAFQTNLLALNAGVEAARAGDAGRGFAVVAQEVRELAQRSASAARQIKSLIVSSAANVKEGVELVGETGKSLEAIASEVSDIKGHVASIVSSTREQETALQEINQAMHSLDRATQENSGMVEESTAATHALAGEADMIASLLAQFKIKTSSAKSGPDRHMLAPGQKLPRAA